MATAPRPWLRAIEAGASSGHRACKAFDLRRVSRAYGGAKGERV